MRTLRFPQRASLGGPGAVFTLVAVCLLLSAGIASAATGPLSPANGQGSTYVGVAMQQWVASAQTQGLNVNYTATSSPAGLTSFAQNQADFAGTEAEFSEIDLANPARGFEYTPDVGGATAIMYHVDNAAGQPITYLHLSPMTIAKIFTGTITNWDDPEISADNHGLVLPSHKILIDVRSGQSGTTALFYDFVKNTDPTDFNELAANCNWSTSVRLIEVDDCSPPPPYSGAKTYPGHVVSQPEGNMIAQTGSDEQAQFIASPQGLWSIGYDEFAYPKEYGVPVAWVENASGNWVQPYATNIAAALQSAVLAPDTSQNLTGVYTSNDPLAYPISAYTYFMTQCQPTSTYATCKGGYTNPGVANTLAGFMQYIACPGQVSMAQLGYSPLPPQLAQFLYDAVNRMNGDPDTTLNASNCNDPTFNGSLGAGATNPNPDPYLNCGPNALAPGGPGCGSASSGTTTTGTGTTTTGKTGTGKTGTGKTGTGKTGTGKSGTGKSGTGKGNAPPTKGSSSGGTETTESATPTVLSPADLGTPVSAATNAGTPLTIKATEGGATASLTVPADALPARSVVSVYPVTVETPVEAALPKGGWKYITAFVVAWKAPNGTVPTALHAITATITDAAITAGSALYSATSTTNASIGTARNAGRVSGSFTADPLLFVTQPPAAATTTGSNSTSNAAASGSPGAGSGSSPASGTTVPAAGLLTATPGTAGTSVAGAVDVRDAKPVAYTRPGIPGPSPWPLIALLVLIAAPLMLGSAYQFRRRVSTAVGGRSRTRTRRLMPRRTR